MDLSPERIQFILLAVVGMILCSAVHEWAHAFTAVKLGDQTPARHGRLTLNPMAHIDPIGTIVMPAVGAAMGFLFGYAKPVPFSPHQLTRRVSMKTGVLLVAMAGPVSNLILAFLCAGLLKLVPMVTTPGVFAENEIAHMVGALLFVGIWLNIVLFIFNFLPIYPLDGSKILEGILPRRHHRILEILRDNSLLVMLFIFAFGLTLLQRPIIGLLRFILDLFSLHREIGPFLQYFG